VGVVVAAVEMKAIREFMDARKRVSVFVHLFATLGWGFLVPVWPLVLVHRIYFFLRRDH
jgi:hypothetical protein